jgi:hypothetical protein
MCQERKSGVDCTKALFWEKAKAKVAIFRQWPEPGRILFKKSTLLSDLWLNLANTICG